MKLVTKYEPVIYIEDENLSISLKDFKDLCFDEEHRDGNGFIFRPYYISEKTMEALEKLGVFAKATKIIRNKGYSGYTEGVKYREFCKELHRKEVLGEIEDTGYKH